MAEKKESSLAYEKLNFILSLPWMQIFTWVLFFLILYSLRSFFTVIFLTFVISYITANVVNGVTGLFIRWEIFRKLIVLLTFAVFLFLAYSAGRFLAPHIVEQGRGVVETVSKFPVDQGVRKVIANAWAQITFTSFRRTADYKRELEAEGAKENVEQLTWEDFKNHARSLRKKFRTDQVQARGKELLEKSRATKEYEDESRVFLLSKVPAESYDDRRQELVEKQEADLRNVLGVREFEAFKKEKEKKGEYESFIQEKIKTDLLAKLPADRKKAYEAEFEEKWIQEQGEKAVTGAEGTPEWEAAFKEYYEGQKLPERHTYDFDKFVKLEKAQDNASFVAIIGAESAQELGVQTLAERFEKKKIQQFAEENEGRLKDMKFIDYVEETAGTVLGTLGVWLTEAVKSVFTFGFHLILSVFFSFIIVMDIPRLKRGVELLAYSRIQRFYHEIVPGLASFGNLMGRAFQAQAAIAMVNTALTLLSLVLLDVGNRAFLCTIVFVCSFIPVAGVVISTVPIALVGLQMPEGGFYLTLKLVGCIILIHFLESMVLNPKILGDMLHLHPLLVLIILTVGGHHFGVWGLLLGVPVCVYIIRHVILRGVDPHILARLAPKTAFAEEAAAASESPDSGEVMAEEMPVEDGPAPARQPTAEPAPPRR